MFLKSTKLFDRMPCSHLQFFDTDTGEMDYSGACAKWHGYSRSFKFEFSGIPDQYGWVVPFGKLKQVRSFLNYYFDHTAIAPANDPRMINILEVEKMKLVELRVLPYGVSMEMSALFVWEIVNAYIMHMTDFRCFVSKLEVIEHEPNSGIIEVSFGEAEKLAKNIIAAIKPSVSEDLLIKKPIWDAEKIHDYLVRNWKV